MPTGFISEIYKKEDIAFPEFVMQCASHFSDLITAQYDSMDISVLNEYVLSTNRCDERLKIAESRLKEIKEWDDQRADQEALTFYKGVLKNYEASMEKYNTLKARCYEDMLAKVNNWNVPTPDLNSLKNL